MYKGSFTTGLDTGIAISNANHSRDVDNVVELLIVLLNFFRSSGEYQHVLQKPKLSLPLQRRNNIGTTTSLSFSSAPSGHQIDQGDRKHSPTPNLPRAAG